MFSATQPLQQAIVHDGSWSLAVGSLISIGSELLGRGDHDEAMATFNTAHSILTSPPTAQSWLIVAKRLEIGNSLLQSGSSQSSAVPVALLTGMDTPPDLYEQDECDVGPRILRTPITVDSRSVHEVALLEAIVIFNKGLVHHSMGNLLEAKQLYEIVAFTVQNMLSFTMGIPSTIFMQLAMRSHNNLGLVSYLEHREGVAAASFEAATQFAKHLAPLSKAYRLEYATALSNWCRVNWMRGDISDNLIKSLKEVLRIRTAVLSWDHPDVGAALYNVAVAEYSRQEGQKAVSHLMQYLAISSHRSKDQNLDDLDAVPALIFLLLIQNEDKEDNMSQDLVRGLRTLHGKRQDLGPNSLEVASVLNYVGTLLFHKQDFESALVFFEEELRLEDIKENVLLDESECARLDETTSVSVTCNNIGRILQELGRFHEAISYYHRALEAEYGDITKLPLASGKESKLDSAAICLKKEAPNIASTCQSSSANLYSTVWYNLGLIHDKLGAYDEAINAFEMSLNLRKILLGCNHSDIACLLYNIGVLQMEQQRLDDASASFREALRIRRVVTAGQLNDRHIVKTLEKLASLQKDKGNLNGALEVTHEVLTIQEVSTEYDSVTRMKEMGATLRSVAELHHAVGALDAAVHTSMDSVNKLRIAADFSIQQHSRNLDPQLEPLLVLDRISNVEQLVTSLLLLGSLFHEISEPVEAEIILRDAAAIVQQTVIASNLCPVIATPSSLHALQEVTMMLGNWQCAPQA